MSVNEGGKLPWWQLQKCRYKVINAAFGWQDSLWKETESWAACKKSGWAGWLRMQRRLGGGSERGRWKP